jgi:hypothetical protein
MNDKTRARLESDLIELALLLEKLGAKDGIDVGLADLAEQLGWARARIRTVLSFAADNPGLGIGIHIKRGRSRLIVLTYDGAENREATKRVTEMVATETRENLTRLIRSACRSFVRIKQADQRYIEAKQLAWASRLQEKFLRDAKFAMESHDDEEFASEIAMIERALAEA